MTRIRKRRKMVARKVSTRRTPLRWFMSSAAIALLFAGLYVFLWTESFTLREIHIHGNKNLSLDTLRSVTAGFLGDNLLTVSLSGLRDRFVSFSEVKDVEFRRRLFHRVDCYVKEREPAALLAPGGAKEGGLLEIDEYGVIIARRRDGCEIDLPVITGIEHKELITGDCNPKLQRALEVLKLLKVFGFSPAKQLSEIHFEEGEVMLVLMGTGTLIRMGHDDYHKKVRKLRAVYGALDEGGDFPKLIDLRFKRQVVVR